MDRSRIRWMALISLALSAVAVAILVPAGLTATPPGQTAGLAAPTATPGLSDCVAALTKAVNPDSIALGDSAQASLGISITCGASNLPVDLIILADESNSMTRGSGSIDPGGGVATATPQGGTPDPGGGTAQPGPTRPGDEPAWCRTYGSGDIPTITPTRRFRTPTPGIDIPTEQPEGAGSEDLVKSVKSWVGDFVDQPEIKRDLDSDRLRIGFLSFNSGSRIKQTLTNQSSKITGAAARLRGGDITRINVGVREAGRMFSGTGSRVDEGDEGRIQILLILSDFQFCDADVRGSRPDENVYVITVGMGRFYNPRNVDELATDRSMALEERDLKEVVHLYEDILAPPIPIGLTELKARDQLTDSMGLIPGSVDPPTSTITGQLIEWQLDPARLPWSLGYRVQPQVDGLQPLSVLADVAWTDSEGKVGSAAFPEVNIEVIPYTATPTATATVTPSPTNTPTATPTPTVTPGPRYLPILYRLWPETKPCVPEEQTIDVGLIIDTSLSMSDPTQAGGQPKLDAAIEAALEIVQLLKPADQATIIGFNATAHLASQLTSDRAQLETALRSLPGTQAQGTGIDKGLQAGFDELQSSRHVAGNTRSLILVTDGTQTTGSEQDVRDVATAIKAAGIKIVTVGLGPDIDEALLTEVASDPSLYFRSPTAEGLKDLYRQIAEIIPCP